MSPKISVFSGKNLGKSPPPPSFKISTNFTSPGNTHNRTIPLSKLPLIWCGVVMEVLPGWGLPAPEPLLLFWVISLSGKGPFRRSGLRRTPAGLFIYFSHPLPSPAPTLHAYLPARAREQRKMLFVAAGALQRVNYSWPCSGDAPCCKPREWLPYRRSGFPRCWLF